MVAALHPPILYTIGHSNQTPDRLRRLLVARGVRTVVDVRSQPYSRYSPQFNHDALARFLEDASIEYLFAGDTLGGRPAGREFYDSEGHVEYFKVAGADAFQTGIARLRFLLQEREGVAVLCSEEDPTTCHRRLLIGRVVAGEGIAVKHIRGDGRVQDEAQLAGAGKVSSLVQRGLFDEAEESAWRSSRSVLPARPRNSSSSR
jgi:uncharacterized protein (DUF488 family)